MPGWKPILIALLSLAAQVGNAQNADSNTTAKPTLWQAFTKGQANGRLRYMFMSTDNVSNLSDYYANALGGYLRYETAPFHHFQVSAGSSFTYNIASSDLTKSDPATGMPNRYEWGLFDLQDPSNRTNMFRLEELYLKYNFKLGNVTWGKQILNTPFINPEDGRMRPTAEDGLWGKLNVKHFAFEGGWLYGISPRGTMRWFSIGNSIGYFPVGVNPDGTRSGYLHNLQSSGIGILGITEQGKYGTMQLWEQYVANMFNTIMAQFYGERPIGSREDKLVLGFQCIMQNAVNNGGSDTPDKTYFPADGISQVLSGRLGWQNKHWRTSLNYTRITKAGRFLMPREWGKEPFFTFLPRERNEGAGDVHAFAVKAGYLAMGSKLWIEAAGGYYKMPDVNNYALNKYAFPPYYQINGDVKYNFGKALKGLETELLLVYKGEGHDGPNGDKYVFNKATMGQVNVIVSYLF